MNKGERQGGTRSHVGAESRSTDSETLAIEALRFFAADPARAERFFTWSGLDAGSIRTAARDPGFGFDVLRYLMQDEPLLLRFAAHAGFDPADIVATYRASLARENSGDDDL